MRAAARQHPGRRPRTGPGAGVLRVADDLVDAMTCGAGWKALARFVATDTVAWMALSAIVGAVAPRVPARALDHDGPLLRLRAVERGGRLWEDLGIRRWKDALPEAGASFGGRSKRHLGGADALGPFVVETRRAELVHWTLGACGPLFRSWNPWPLALVMITFGVGANAPFVAVQRYNRARALRALDARARRRAASPATRAARTTPSTESPGGGQTSIAAGAPRGPVEALVWHRVPVGTPR